MTANPARHGYREPMAQRLITDRLVLRPWTVDDADTALASYGHGEVARWLAPAMDSVPDAAAMRLVLQQWIAEDARIVVPAGRWALALREDGRPIGGAILVPLPPAEGVGMAWRVHPGTWGRGDAADS